MAAGFNSETHTNLPIISASFCPLRWTYMQVDLEHGRVKACCKTPFVRITESDIQRLGPESIFNCEYFRERRREMLDGLWHDDCSSCWTQEQMGIPSYRQSESIREPHLAQAAKIASGQRTDRAVPKHIEFILSTRCDMKCSYCGPDFSSSWAADIQTHGPLIVLPEQPNLTPACPGFEQTFWKWFDANRGHVVYVQFNGGEPLIQSEFYKTMEHLEGLNALEVGIVTNLNTPPAIFERLLGLLPRWKCQHRLRFGVSQDSVGERAEYIRHGLQWKRFENNLRGLLINGPQLSIRFIISMSILNVTSISKLLEYLEGLVDVHGPRIEVTPNIVMMPEFLSPFLLSSEYCIYLEEAIARLEMTGRWPELKQMLLGIAEAITRPFDRAHLKRKFALWVGEQDKRRKVPFVTVFPELEPLLAKA